jgi:hypothetical protein
VNKILSYKQFEAVGISPYTVKLSRKIYSDISKAIEQDFKLKLKNQIGLKPEFTYDLRDYYDDTKMLFGFKLKVVYDPSAETSYCRSEDFDLSRPENKYKNKENKGYLIVIKQAVLRTIMHEVNHLTDYTISKNLRINNSVIKGMDKDPGLSMIADIFYISSKPEIKSIITEVYTDLLLKNTTRHTFHSNLLLNDSYNLMLFLRKIIDSKFDTMLNSDKGAIYVYKWLNVEKEVKKNADFIETYGDVFKYLAKELKKWISGIISKKEKHKATKEQVDRFIKKYKAYCLKNINTFLKKCSKLYSLFTDKPTKISDFTDRDYNKLISDFKSSFGQILNVDDESLKKMVNDLKNGKDFKVEARLKSEKEIEDLIKSDL